MATEEKKLANRMRVTEYTLVGMAAALWNMLGESCMALVAPIGEELLKVTEKEMGLEIAGETPEAVLTEVGRLFVDEFGYYKETSLEKQGNTFTIYAKDAITKNIPKMLKEAGVDKYFFSPALLISLAVLKRMGLKARGDVVPWPEGNGLKVIVEIMP